MTTTANARRSKPAAPAPAEDDARADAEVAADRLIAALRVAIDRLPEPSNLDGVAGELTAAFQAIDADPTPVITAASAAVATYWNHSRMVDVRVRRADAQAAVAAVLAAVDAALGGAAFTRRGELNRAQAQVAALEAERRQVLADLEQAVAAGDIDRVLELRPRLEVALPAAQDAARLAVAELQLEQAEAQRDRPHRRAEAAAHAEQAARVELEKAQAALQEATAAAEAAVQQRLVAEQVAAQVEQTARDLGREVGRLRQDNAQSLTQRLRRLAGLAPETPTAPSTNEQRSSR